ncbi:hypothetical protein AB832_04585 [Flavobacteriaceae bacterium (ex Bugula neritina AB1)]|nr:hypothetical protein AB832_04585 [Flavobacteriaceae bacterium (ex Bugula neritina AB1)]
MKLTNTQINGLQDFIKSNGVKYYDVQMELLDHFIVALETETELSFGDKTKLVFKDFGGKEGFRHIVKEKKRVITRQFFKLYFQSFRAFFSLPKIILTLAIFTVLQFILKNIQLETGMYNLVAQLLNAVLIIQTSFKKGVFEKSYIKGKDFLMLKTQDYFQIVIAIPIFLIMLFELNFGKFIPVTFVSICITLSIIMLLAYSSIRKHLIKKMIELYPEAV